MTLGALAVSVAIVASCAWPSATGSAPADVSAAASETPTPTPEPTSSLAWSECEAPFECATLPVPIDHEQPDGRQIELALIRLPAPASADRIGSLVVNPGGPGASGVEFVRQAAVEAVPAEVRTRFDIVGFDPRGVGASSPIDCGPEVGALFAHDLTADEPAEVSALLAAAQRLADACARSEAADLLPHVSTVHVARDLDLIRAAVGDARLTYVGFSYGSLLGATYAELFPDRVRALVLDGAVDPTLDALGRATEHAQALERALVDFLAACSEEARCALPPDASTLGTVDALLADLETQPLPADGPQGRELGPGDARLAMMALLRDRETGWPWLGEGLAQADAGDGSLLLAVADAVTGRSEWTEEHGELGALLAVNCLDVPAPDVARFPEVLVAAARAAPRFGAASVSLWSPCTVWPIPAQGTPGPIRATGSAPVVVIGSTGDAVTPYRWSVRLSEQLESATLMTREGDRHTAFGGRNVCTDRAVGRYLIDGILPPPGWSCG